MVVEPGLGLSEAAPLALDAFGFFPSFVSRIDGVGGDAPPIDPQYAFHTLYVPCGEGRIDFTLRFDGLKATRGTLTLRVNALPLRPGAAAMTVANIYVPFRNIIYDEGAASVRVDAKPNATYALIGYVHDESDASADGLAVEVIRVTDLEALTEQRIEARRTAFGTAGLLPTARLIAHDPPTLANPVSQMCTARQFDEPAYAGWLGVIGAGMRRACDQWNGIYVLQALRRYGMLEEGARGLGFGVGTESLPAIMAAAGCDVVATDLPPGPQAAAGIDALRRPALCPEPLFDKRVRFHPVDMTALSTAPTGFDFLWSCDAIGHLGDAAAGLRFVAEAVECLKPGGIAVHTAGFVFAADGPDTGANGAVLFRRRDFERLALMLISHGHEVAQFKYDPAGAVRDDAALDASNDDPIATSFGIIIRRGLNT